MTNQSLRTGSIDPGRAFTLVVQALVVVAVIAVLIALLFPATEHVREAAARTEMINNLKQVVLATHNAHSAWKKLPPASGPYGKATGNYSLSVHLLPYLEQMPLYSQTALAGQTMPTTVFIQSFKSPLDFTTADWVRVQNFACNLRVFTDAGFAAYDPKTGYINIDETTISPLCTSNMEDRFPNGTSNTMMFTTRYASSGETLATNGSGLCSNYDVLAGTPAAGSGAYFGGIVATGTPDSSFNTKGGWQINPTRPNVNCDPGLGGKEPGSLGMSFGSAGLTVGIADGSVRQVGIGITAQTWNAALQPNGPNQLGSDW